MGRIFGKYSDMELYKALREKKPMAEAAFSELYSRYAQRVFAYCLRVMGNHDDAQDIFQETFIKVINTLRAGAYNEEGKFYGEIPQKLSLAIRKQS